MYKSETLLGEDISEIVISAYHVDTPLSLEFFSLLPSVVIGQILGEIIKKTNYCKV